MDVVGVFVASWRQWFLPIDGIVGAIHRDPQLLPSEPLNCMYTASRAAVRAAPGTTLARFVLNHTLRPGCGHPAFVRSQCLTPRLHVRACSQPVPRHGCGWRRRVVQLWCHPCAVAWLAVASALLVPDLQS